VLPPRSAVLPIAAAILAVVSTGLPLGVGAPIAHVSPRPTAPPAQAILPAPNPTPLRSEAHPGIGPGEQLAVTDRDPGDVALEWGGVPAMTFEYYEIDASYAGATGPWYMVRLFNDPSTTQAVIDRLAPGATTDFRVIVHNATGRPVVSNVVTVTLPTVSYLQFTQVSATSLQFTWNDNATYGDLIAFHCYKLVVSINDSYDGGSCLPNGMTNTTTTVTGLLPLTDYSYEIQTVDQVGAGPPLAGGPNVSTWSNPVDWDNGAGEHTGGTLFDTGYCDPGQQTVFTALSSGGTPPYNVTWYNATGASTPVNGYGETAATVYGAPGYYLETIDVTDSGGGGFGGIQVDVVKELSVAAAANRTEIAPGTPVAFSTNASGGSGSLTYSWNLGNGTMVTTGPSVVYDFPTPVNGSFNVTVVAVDLYGGYAFGEVTVRVSPLEANVGGWTASWALIGEKVEWDATPSGGGGGPYSVSWNYGNGQKAQGADVTYNYSKTGNYTPTVTVEDVLHDSRTVDVLPVLSIYDPLRVGIGSPSPINPVAGELITLSAGVTGGSGRYSCVWSPEGESPYNCTLRVIWNNPGTYQALLTVVDSVLGNASANLSVVVGSPPAKNTSTPGSAPLEELAVGGAALLVGIAAVAALVLRRRHQGK
jgi:hypothetical protein